jgi:hypothetical protein
VEAAGQAVSGELWTAHVAGEPAADEQRCTVCRVVLLAATGGEQTTDGEPLRWWTPGYYVLVKDSAAFQLAPGDQLNPKRERRCEAPAGRTS